MARMTSEVACDPELPPLEMMSGTNSASTTALAISCSKKPIAVAVSISPRKSAESQPARFRSMREKAMLRYGSPRASVPPNFWISSVASSLTTSTTSSTVTTPFILRCASTTGMAMRPLLRNTRETASWSRSSPTVTTSVFITSRTRAPRGEASSSWTATTPRRRCS